MSFVKTPTKEIAALLEKRGVDWSNAVGFTDADMNNECEFQEFWMLLLKEELVFVELPRETGVKTFSGYPHKEDKLPPAAEDLVIRRFALSRLSDAGVCELVSGCAFFIKLDQKETRLCVFSSGKTAGARKFAELFSFVLSGEDIPERIYKADEHSEFCEKCGTPYIDRERRICPKCMDTRSIFKRSLSYFKPYTALIIVLMLSFVAASVVAALQPYLSGAVYFDEVLAKKSDFSGIWSLAGGDFAILLCLVIGSFLVVRVAELLLTIVQNLIVAKIVPRVVRKVKEDVFSSLKNLSLRFFTDRTTGFLMTRVMSDANEVTGFFLDGLPMIFGNIL